MPIKYKKRQVTFQGLVSVEEAESLLEWLQENPTAKVDLSACTHVHPANLQVLLAAKARISAWPVDGNLAGLLKTVFNPDK